MNRGNRREDIFLTDQDRKVFVDGLADSCEIYHIKLIAYVLMAMFFSPRRRLYEPEARAVQIAEGNW
jgi:hypothetical protein